MYKSIDEFFNINLKHIKIDKRLIKALKDFRYEWCTKSDDYIDFLGSNLFGVHKIAFSKLDDAKLIEDTLKIRNITTLQKDIFRLDGMEEKFKIASNIIYQILTYLIHRFLTSDLANNDKQAGITECCLIMQYRMFTSLYAPRFQYNTTEKIATMVYHKLSHKFLMKQLGSWQAMFQYRVDVCLDTNSVNYIQVERYTTLTTIDFISAIQTKIRGVVNEMYTVHMEVVNSGEAIGTESSTFKGGENDLEQVSDSDKGAGIYVNRVLHIAQKQNDFIDMETVDIVASMFKNVDKDVILKFFHCMSDTTFMEPNKLTNLIEGSITLSLNYLRRRNINIERPELIPKALIDIKTYWSSSRVKNADMDDIKDILQARAEVCTGRKTAWLLITLALIYITYIFLRSVKK